MQTLHYITLHHDSEFGLAIAFERIERKSIQAIQHVGSHTLAQTSRIVEPLHQASSDKSRSKQRSLASSISQPHAPVGRPQMQRLAASPLDPSRAQGRQDAQLTNDSMTDQHRAISNTLGISHASWPRQSRVSQSGVVAH